MKAFGRIKLLSVTLVFLAFVSPTWLVENFVDRDSFTNTQRENCTQQEQDERQYPVSDGGSSVLDEEMNDEEELPEYFQHLNVISDSTSREEGENSLRIAVECHNLESLERLWEDYHSGRLNAIAEKRLVIKSRFHVKSVNLTTTILEEDYLACKEFFTNTRK